MRERKQIPAGFWFVISIIPGGIAWYFIMREISQFIQWLL